MTSSTWTQSSVGRMVIAAAVLGPWLMLITSRQTALYHGGGGGPPGAELLPMPVTIVAMAGAVAIRMLRPSIAAHAVCLAVLVCGLALLAASLGTPFANATWDYCGDFCRSAIMARTAAFFGWPLLAAAGLTVAARLERAKDDKTILELAAWSRAWVPPTLILGLAAAVVWYQIILS